MKVCKKISIIIPFYNVEEYIEECYNSVYLSAQKHLEDIEIILVDDCGKDRSLEIIERIKGKNTKIVRNKKNLGLGGARNTGIKNSSGEWIMFVDSDDRIREDSITILLNKIEESKDINVIKYGYLEEYKDKKIEYLFKENDFYVHNPIMAWSKILKRNICLDFENKLKHEDIYWKYKFIEAGYNNIAKVDKINESIYIYNKMNDNSITQNKNYEDIEKIYGDIMKSIKICKDKEIKNELREMILIMFIYYTVLSTDIRLSRKAIIYLIKVNPFLIKENIKFIKNIVKYRMKYKIIK